MQFIRGIDIMIRRTVVGFVAVLSVSIFSSISVAQSGSAVQYSYDDVGRLIRVVDQSGNVATYSYDAVGNILSIARTTLPGNGGLAIIGFSPQQGTVGQVVTIAGQGFSPTPGNNTVQFNGATTTVSAASATSLTVAVPSNATSGPISVTVGGTTVNADKNFVVIQKTLVSLAVTPQSGSSLRLTQQFRAAGTFSDGTTQDLTTTATWSSSNSAVATINNAGLATAVTSGLVTITATLASVTGSSTVPVSAISSITVFPAVPSITTGASLQFTGFATLADGSRQNFTSQVTWISSNPAVATISNASGTQGLATAVSTGSTVITATVGSFSGSTDLIVNSTTAAAFPRFMFAANSDGTLSQSVVDARTGKLRANGYSFPGLSGGQAAVAVDVSGKFAYVANGSTSDSVSGFVISNNGTLTSISGSPFATGSFPVALAIDPLTRFLYVINEGSNNISAFSINSTTGSLTPTPNSPFVGGTGPSERPDGVAIDPAGKFVFVANGGTASVSVYSINQQTGDLTELSASPFAAGTGPSSVTVDPRGRVVYVTNAADNAISAFSIDPSSGNLTPIAGSPFSAGFSPASITIDPAGRFAYVANENDHTVSAFNIDFTSGGLTQVFGSPYTTGPSPVSVNVDPSGQFVYVVNSGENTVSVFSIDPVAGGLTAVASFPQRAPSSIAITSGSSPVTFTPQFAYVANAGPPSGSNNISGYAISNSTGSLSPLTGSPFAEGFSPAQLTVDPLGPFLYAADKCSDLSCASPSGSVFGYSIDPNAGALSALQGSPYAAGSNPLSVAVDPSGRFVYAANNADSTLSVYAISASNGSLSPVTGSPFATESSPVAVAIDSTGEFLYVVSACGVSCSNGSISAYTIAVASGTPASVNTLAVGNTPQSVVVDPTGKFAYVVNKGDGTVSAFTIERSTGNLNPTSGSPFATGQNPSSVVVDPTGAFAYTTNSGDNNVSAYTISSSSGALSATSGSPFATGTNPVSLSIDISGSFLYVVNQNSNSVSTFAINPVSGALTPVSGSPFGTGPSPVSITTTGTAH